MDRWRVLVVDDDEDTCDLIRMTLEEEFDVATTIDPQQAKEILEIFEPDLIILDVMMPKITGFQLAGQLKQSPAWKNIPIVFLSAKGTAKDQKYGYSLGASLYLTKPFEATRLAKNLHLMLDGKDIQRKVKKLSMHEVSKNLSGTGCKVSVTV